MMARLRRRIVLWLIAEIRRELLKAQQRNGRVGF